MDTDQIMSAIFLIAVLALILPGFFTDSLGFLLLIPFTRKLIIKLFLKKRDEKNDNKKKDFIEAEIIESEENKKDEL